MQVVPELNVPAGLRNVPASLTKVAAGLTKVAAGLTKVAAGILPAESACHPNPHSAGRMPAATSGRLTACQAHSTAPL